MKLRLISDYGADEHLVASDATPEVAKKTIQDLDWHRFHQVIAEKENGDWFEVRGSLHPSDGLSVCKGYLLQCINRKVAMFLFWLFSSAEFCVIRIFG